MRKTTRALVVAISGAVVGVVGGAATMLEYGAMACLKTASENPVTFCLAVTPVTCCIATTALLVGRRKPQDPPPYRDH